MQRKIYKKDEKGNAVLVKTCIDDSDFFRKTRDIMLENGANVKDITYGELKNTNDAIVQLERLGYWFEYDGFAVAIDSATTKLAEAVMKVVEESNFSLSKIKIDRVAETGEIYYYQGTQKCSKEVKFVGYEQVLPEFLTLFRAMTKHLVTVLDFPEEWLDKITTTGLSITYKDDEAMGMVITAQMTIEGLNAPLNLNTPFIKFSSYGSAHDCCDDVMFMPDCEKELEELFHHSRLYMKGETRQKQLSLLDEIEASALEG